VNAERLHSLAKAVMSDLTVTKALVNLQRVRDQLRSMRRKMPLTNNR